MNKFIIPIIVIAIIAAGIGAYFILQKPALPEPQISKCGDGVCGPIEKKNPNLCPKDCQQARSSVTQPILQQQPTPQSPETQKINVLLVVHTGEGECEMTNITDINNSVYKKCKDDFKKISLELKKLEIPALFELVGPFAELLSKDTNFSLENDIIANGHNTGFHAHDHCYRSYHNDSFDSILCKTSENLNWGKIGIDQKPIIEELIYRIDSAMLFSNRTKIGGIHGMAFQFNENKNKLFEELNKRGIKIWTGTAAVKNNYSSNSQCSRQNINLNPHPITPNADYPNIIYIDHGPVFGNNDLIGHQDFNIEKLKNRFKSLLQCKNEEKSSMPYIFAMGTHMWNIRTNIDEIKDVYDGISDLTNFKKWLDENYKNIFHFSKIENVYSDYLK